MRTRVVITGLGVVSPIGIGVERFWSNALSGQSGVTAIAGFDGFPLEAYRSRVAGQVLDFDAAQLPEAAQAARVDRYAQFTLAATAEAIEDAGLRIETEDPHRVGVIVGAGMGAMAMAERELTRLHQRAKPQRVHPALIPTLTLNSASGIVALVHGAKGPNLTISTACSSSAHAIGQALILLRAGQADVVIAAGADASITPLVFAGFCSMRAMSSSFNDTPSRASRPFDRSRDGFVMGEGAGVLILETLAHAQKRGARVRAEVAGYAATSEAHHMVIPREDGAEVAETMRRALADAGAKPAGVDYINAHATSTPIGDVVEARAIRSLFQEHADRMLVNATKSLIGHTLGAAGALGAAASVLSLESGQVHPTLNYDDPEPECALAGISTSIQRKSLEVALLNAFGFGSNNATLVMKRAP